MPPPTTANNFLQLLRDSDLVEPARLDAFLENNSSSLPSKPAALAKTLLRAGMLTDFQVQQLLKGKWRGFILGKYRLLEILGSGGMGRVFLGEHVQLHRLAALKIPPIAHAQDPAIVERFYREARAVAALDHPNIVRAYDVDNDGKHHFLIMEFVDGNSLHRMVADHGPMDVIRACHYVAQAAAGLDHAHQAGWIHRDVKPSNLLVDRHGTVKILDLGLALFFPEDRDGLSGKYDQGTVLGSADFLAPEQVFDSSHGLDPRSDVYSLGATFYYLLAGQLPFGEGNAFQKLLWHQLRDPQPIRQLRREVPAALAAIVSRMMAKDRDQRFPSLGEVVAALEQWTVQAIDPPAPDEMPNYCPLIANLIKTSVQRSPTPGVETRHKRPPSTDASIRATRAPSGRRGRRRWLLVGCLPAALVVCLVPAWFFFQGVSLPWTAVSATPSQPSQSTSTRPFESGILTPTEAARHINQKCTVQMTVRSIGWSNNQKMFFLNSEANYKSAGNFTVLSHNVEEFAALNIPDPPAYYQGKTIRVTGTVTLYLERPQIIVNDPKQIEVVKD
jgi:serine/threonine protein kinase